MKKILPSCQFELSGRLNMVCMRGTPLPDQGEKESEGLFKASRAGKGTPHLNPLPFSESRSEKSHSRLSDKSALRGVLKTTSK
jgi:hypothetical protein